jgi:hypothetical protein
MKFGNWDFYIMVEWQKAEEYDRKTGQTDKECLCFIEAKHGMKYTICV